MILCKMKNGDIENTKLDFRGWFYKFIIKIGYFSRKITKRSSEFANLVKKYEICDFGGSFGNLSAFLSVLFGEMGRNSVGNMVEKCRKITKRSSKNAKWVFDRLKTRIGLFEDLLIIYRRFSLVFFVKFDKLPLLLLFERIYKKIIKKCYCYFLYFFVYFLYGMIRFYRLRKMKA